MMSPKDKPKKRPPKDSMTLLPCFYFVELPIVASSMASLYFLELTDVLQPAMVGFLCHDRTLSMPYVDASEELIPLLMLLSLAFAGPAASIMLGEGLLYCLQSRLKLRLRSEGSINAGGCNFNSFLRRTVRFVGVQIFGLLATALVTDVIQLATGHHTPFFLTVCQPNYTAPGVSCEKNPYITRDICSGRDQHAILAARKSFPSQHATLSAFAAVYISMYFNSTISGSTKLLKPVLVFAFCMAAVLTGLTQISQHHSHPIDVYGGFLIGSSIAAYLALFSVGNFKSSEEPTPQPSLSQQSPHKDALIALAQRGHDSVYHKGGACGSSSEELGEGPGEVGEKPRKVRGRREKASLGGLKRTSADVELMAPRGSMGRKETMVTFSHHTLPRANCSPGLALGPPHDPDDPTHRRPLTFLAPPLDSDDPSHRRPLTSLTFLAPPLDQHQLMHEWKQRSLDLREVGQEEGLERGSSFHGSDRGEREDGRRPELAGGERSSAAPSPAPLYPTMQQQQQAAANWGGLAMATPPASVASGTPPRATMVTPQPVVPPPVVHIREEDAAKGPPPVSPKSATMRTRWLSMSEQGGATGDGAAVGGVTGGGAAVSAVTGGGAVLVGVTGGGVAVGGVTGGGVPGMNPGSLRAPGQPRVAQVIAMSKQEGRVSLSPRSSETLSSSCASTSSSSESACCHVPERGSSGILTINAHAPHHPLVHLPPSTSNGTPWGWRTSSASVNGGGAGEIHELRPAKSLSPASSVDGHGHLAPPQYQAVVERAASFERGPSFERVPSFEHGASLVRGPSLERAGSTERAVALERAGSLLQRSANQL